MCAVSNSFLVFISGSLILFDLLSNQKSGSQELCVPPIPKANGDTKQVCGVKSISSCSCSYVASVSRHFSLLLQAAAPSAPDNPSVCTPAADERLKEDGEDFEDLSSVLQHLGLSEYKTTFNDEKIDIESFVRIAAGIHKCM